MKKTAILMLLISGLIIINSCNKKENTNPILPSVDCSNPNTDTTGTGLKVKYNGYNMSLPNSVTASGGNPIYAVVGANFSVYFSILAPSGIKRIEATKSEYGQTTSFENFPVNSVIATDTTLKLEFILYGSKTEINVTVVDKNCKSTSYTLTLHPLLKSNVYSGKKLYSQHTVSPNSSFYSTTKSGSYVSGGELVTTMDITLAYKVGAASNYDPYFYSPNEKFGALVIPKGQTAPVSGSPGTYYTPTTKSLTSLTATDIFQAIGTAGGSTLKIEAGKTYFYRSYTSPKTTYGAITINSISGINNEVVDFDYAELY